MGITKKSKPLAIYRVKAECDACGGDVDFTGRAREMRGYESYMTKPMEYEHKCEGCETVYWLDSVYPHNEEKEL